MTFEEIFKRYYSLWRGNASTIPASTSREYLVGLEFANDAIDEWSRVDGIQWPELWVNSVDEDAITIADGTVDYDVTDMQEPPAKITLSTSDQTVYLKVIKPWEVKDYSDLTGMAYFTGSANTEYTFHITSDDSTAYDDYAVDFPYIRKPTQMTADDDEPDMSDPGFIVHHMVALQAQRQQKGFLFKSSESKAREKLSDMKVKALSGTYGNSSREREDTSGWGVAGNTSFFGR